MCDLLLTGIGDTLVTMGYVKIDRTLSDCTVSYVQYQRGSDKIHLMLHDGDLYVMLAFLNGDDVKNTGAAETMDVRKCISKGQIHVQGGAVQAGSQSA